MFLRFLAALAAGLICAASAPAQKPDAPIKLQPQPKPGAAEAILKGLHSEVSLGDTTNINDIPLFELLQGVSKRHDVTFVIMEEYFKAVGVMDIKEKKPNLAATKLKGVTLHRFLTIVLASMDARYVVRGDYLEIVPLAPAAAKPGEGLVSVVVKEKPLNEVVEKLAEEYDLSVVIAPQSGDARTGFVTARLKNQPPEVALELLAVQCDLRVVRKGSAFLITSRDHANELFAEKMEKERMKIEVEKFRQAPPPRPQPQPEPKP